MLVCAPTGAGKTVVGEFGAWLALRNGGKAFYTTPLKALSNQKFGDFIARHGAEQTGLLTGDNSINGEAGIVVMTTEVLRNMLYERSPTLRDLSVVVLDEVHYLQDTYRGATWEEVLIHLPPSVAIVALSATVSNAQEFGDWIRSVRGDTTVIVEHERPVPIEHLYMVGDRLHPMFVDERGSTAPNPALRRLEQDVPRDRGRRQGRGGRRPRSFQGRGRYRPDRVDVVRTLDDEGLLPGIVFIFSRAGCDEAVERCRRAGVRLTDDDERERIREYVQLRAQVLPEHDLEILGFHAWAEALELGVAAHHAGMIPLFKETVEELFERALCKVVFATETLALGINMPAKTVVLERLIKFTGEKHELMTPTDFTQLTGRAGRRGMDEVGFGVTLWQSDVPFERITQLAEGRSFPITSSFRPSYNMAVNLLRVHGVDEATRLLNLSFGQFLIDRSVVGQQRRIERNEGFITGYLDRARCDMGDVESYWAQVRDARASERDEAARAKRERADRIRAALATVARGQVIAVDRGARAGLVAVIEQRSNKRGDPAPIAIGLDGRLSKLQVRDFREPPGTVGRIEVPPGNPRAPAFKQRVAEQLADLEPTEPVPLVPAKGSRGSGRAVASDHPVHACPDRADHERWMQRVDELRDKTENMQRRVASRTGSLARTFRRVVEVLRSYGYIDGDAVTDKGARLARIYNESDLLIAEAIDAGLFDDLSAAEVAAFASVFVYETRQGMPEERFASAAPGDAFTRLRRLYRRIVAAEEEQRLALVKEPDPGFAVAIQRWASGAELDEVLEEGEWSPGDFVRSTKQVWDLLRQLEDLQPDPAGARRFREAASAIHRGVVAYAGTL